jgi:hypothetical protein
MDSFLQGYTECALWCSDDDNGEPLDRNYSPTDIDSATLTKMEADCNDFQQSQAELLEQSGLDDAHAGHDFWLSRCGHGSGFFDRGLGEVGDKLQAAARVYGEVNLHVANGKVFAL